MKWTPDRIRATLREHAHNGIVSSVDVGMTVTVMARRHYGDFNCACSAAGLVSKKVDSRKTFTGVCQATDCSGLTGRRGKYCEKHYCRIRRHGHTGLSKPLKPLSEAWHISSGGYIVDHRRHTHPLSDSKGLIYQHRRVLFDHIKSNQINCAICGVQQSWQTCHVDHIDCNKTNNIVSNLRVSCPSCNIGRGVDKMRHTKREQAYKIEFDGHELTKQEWANRLGISRSAMSLRLSRWPLERAMTEKRGKSGPVSGR
jgi:hypothetical protein